MPPLCCPNCFASEHETLINYINASGQLGDCSFCGSKGIKVVEPGMLAELFNPIVGMYEPIGEFIQSHDVGMGYGRALWQAIDEDWIIFNGVDAQRLFNAIYPPAIGKDALSGPSADDDVWENAIEYRGSDHLSEPMRAAWSAFCEEIKHNNRFSPKSDFDFAALDRLFSVFESRIDKGVYCRARKSEKKLRIAKMGKPPSEKTPLNRLNPRGISYLYLAENINTALAEIRAIPNDSVTIGEFIFIKPAKVLDLSRRTIGSPFIFGRDIQDVLYYRAFLFLFAEQISLPISAESADLEYIPIQFIGEYIKQKGYDGIIYKSSVTEGKNLVLFDDAKVKCKRVSFVKVTTLSPAMCTWVPSK